MPGDVLRTVGAVSLDWSGPEHWASTVGCCRGCQTGTRGRDAGGPVHQSCAERELADQIRRLAVERFGRLDAALVDERYPRGGTA